MNFKTPDSSWIAKPKKLNMGQSEVHVWQAALDAKPGDFVKTLSPGELERTEKFFFQKDKNRFICAHGLLRTILGLYLNKAPKRLLFSYNLYGKPTLTGISGGNNFYFNMSYSNMLLLIAVTSINEVGVDIEYMRPGLPYEEMAEKFFSSQEVAAIQRLPIHTRKQAFFNCWTSKESFIKAVGMGLSLPLDRFQVSLTPGEPAALLAYHGEKKIAYSWSLKELHTSPGYAAAIAVKGDGWKFKRFKWSNQ